MVDGKNESLYYPDEEFEPNLKTGSLLQKITKKLYVLEACGSLYPLPLQTLMVCNNMALTSLQTNTNSWSDLKKKSQKSNNSHALSQVTQATCRKRESLPEKKQVKSGCN